MPKENIVKKMEIAIIPQFLIKHLSSDFHRQNDYNIMMSNLIIILFFACFGNSLMSILDYIPHFCLIDKMLGVECPVCGTTRAFCDLSNGNLNNAFLLNRTSILVAFFFLSQIPLRVFSILEIVRPEKINLISTYFSRTVLFFIILNWIINLFINT